MTTNDAKIGAVALTLAATWATAQADDFNVSIATTSTALSNVRVYTQRIPGLPASQTPDNKALTASLGSIAANGTLNAVVSTSYGTSPAAGNDFADFSVVATNGALGVIVGGASSNSTFNYADSFPAISQSDAFAAISAGSLANVSRLYNQGRNYGNDVFASRDNSVQTGTRFFFDASCNQNRIGTYTVSPVPEPATMAVLGLGAVGLMRRRRRA